uniref:Uncharacterized protein n=1 Tax=Eutreptiella gymnastica TaxID=73025 RepID=A0A7S4LD14_9EUGL
MDTCPSYENSGHHCGGCTLMDKYPFPNYEKSSKNTPNDVTPAPAVVTGVCLRRHRQWPYLSPVYVLITAPRQPDMQHQVAGQLHQPPPKHHPPAPNHRKHSIFVDNQKAEPPNSMDDDLTRALLWQRVRG